MQRRPPGTTTTLTLFPYRAGCHARVAGATLGVPVLSGQVANIITASTGVSGSFAWRPQIRARRTEARLTNGEVSVSGKAAGFDYTLSLANDSFRNGNAGQEIVFTPDRTIIDRRHEVPYDPGEDTPHHRRLHRKTPGRP